MQIEKIVLSHLVIIAIICWFIIRKHRRNKKLKTQIINEWGKEPEERYNTEDMKNLSSFFRNIEKSNPSKHFIDDITWNDLDMDMIYMRLNNTQSTIGEECLYYLLRTPVLEEKNLLERERLIDFFQKNPTQRLSVQFILAKLGKRRYLRITDYFFDEEKRIPVKGYLYKALSALLILSLILLLVNAPLGILVILCILITNITIYNKEKNEITSHLHSLSYIVNMISCGKKLSKLGIDEIGEYGRELNSSHRKIKSFSVKSFYSLFYRTEDPFLEYIKVVFLGELIAFESLLKVVYKHRDDLKTIYYNIGLLDSLIAAASYRDSIEYYATPQLFKCEYNSSKILKFEKIYHPLIKEPVTNSAKLDKPVLITGSNASGKSTFLKTIGVNAIFSQTIYTSLARKYSSPYFLIFSSMAIKDSIVNSESYFMAEIKSIKRIFNNLNSSTPCLCLIDEVLRGTNTVERIAASSQVLYSFAMSNCLCIAATHDIEIPSILTTYFDNYHFRESFLGNDIVFDYKLYPGKSTTRNAIKLLRIMGYDHDIVNSAEERALTFIKEGKWGKIDD